jgi:hypothetical protein
MKEKTNELIAKVLMENGHKLIGRVERETGKKFTTGQDILKECEQFEKLIEEEGEEAFLKKVKEIVGKRDSGQKEEVD